MKTLIKNTIKWTLAFSKRVIVLVTVLWSIQSIYSAIMIFYAIRHYGEFSYLDTFITDNGETFRLIVGTYLLSKTIENVFKYNEGGIFGKSVKPQVEENTDVEAVG